MTDIWRAEEDAHARPEHIEAGAVGDLFLVAPATADFLARAAHGLADDIVTLSLLAYQGPVIIAPAMHDKMSVHTAVKKNMEILKDRGVQLIEPESGHLACGSFGAGRLADVDVIDRAVERSLAAATQS